MKYDFESIMDRHGKDAIAVDGLGMVPGFTPDKPKDGFDAIPMWVADMNFPTVPTIQEEIIKREKDIKKYQQEVFGPEGDLIKKRLELIKPIQERVFAAINQYAETNQITMVIDRANNQTLLYYAPALDKTNAIITLLKQ